MTTEIIPIAFTFSVIAFVVCFAILNPKQLAHIRDLCNGSAEIGPRASDSKTEGPSKDRKWGSKIRNWGEHS